MTLTHSRVESVSNMKEENLDSEFLVSLRGYTCVEHSSGTVDFIINVRQLRKMFRWLKDCGWIEEEGV